MKLQTTSAPARRSRKAPPVAGRSVSIMRNGSGTAAMRKPKDPVANRTRIVRAAIDEFAARGFEGASMDAIAARTRTTRAMINYYFGSKEKTYIAVLEHVYAQIRNAESLLDLDHLRPVDAIRRVVQFTFDYYLANQGFVHLVVAENQARGRHLRKSSAMRSLNRPIIETLTRVIVRGQAEGDFRSDVDPVDIHMSIAALGIFNVTNQFTFGAIFQREMGSRGDVGHRRQMVGDMVLAYLRGEGKSSSKQAAASAAASRK